MASPRGDWVTYRCTCGFKLERVPVNVMSELPRCLGCGKTLRAERPRLKTRSLVDVRDLR